MARNHATIASTAEVSFIPRISGQGDGGPMSKLSLVDMIMLLKREAVRREAERLLGDQLKTGSGR